MLRSLRRPNLVQPRFHAIFRTNSTDAQEGKTFPEPPTSNHNSLASFLEYASRIGLDTSSTVYNGTLYEYTVTSSLARLGITARRVGAAHDRGIDLVGYWSMPTRTEQPRVFVQCKILSSKQAGPVYIRELEGAFRGAPTGWRDEGVIGLLVTTSAPTQSLRESMGRSRLPMGQIQCSIDGVLEQMAWNSAGNDHGLARAAVVQRFKPTGGTEIKLLWDGEIAGRGQVSR